MASNRSKKQDDFDMFASPASTPRRRKTVAPGVAPYANGGPSGPAMFGGPSGPAMAGGPSGPAMFGGPSGPAMIGASIITGAPKRGAAPKSAPKAAAKSAPKAKAPAKRCSCKKTDSGK